MDNFLTRLVRRTLGLIPVVQPMIASNFAPKEVVLDNYSSGFEIETNTTEPFWDGEMSTSSPSKTFGINALSDSLGVSPTNLSTQTSSLFENRIPSLSTFEQLVESGNDAPIGDSSTLKISNQDPQQSTVAQSHKQGNYIYNQPELDIIPDQKIVGLGTSSPPLSQEALSSSVELEPLLSPRSIGEEIQSEKANNSGADEFNTVLRSNFNKNISTFSHQLMLPDKQPNSSNIVPQNYSEEVTPNQKAFQESLERVEPLVKGEIETDKKTEPQPSNVPVARYSEGVPTRTDKSRSWRSHLETNPQQQDALNPIAINDVSRTDNPLSRIKSLVGRMFQTQQENTLSSQHEQVELPTNSLRDRLKIDDTVNLPPDFPVAVSQSNSDVNEQIKIQNIIDSPITELPLAGSETIRTVQQSESFKLNQIQHLNNNEISNKIMPVVQQTGYITDLNYDQPYDPKVDNLSISQPDTLSAHTITSTSLQPVGNQEKPEIKAYTNKIANQLKFQPTPILVNSKPRVNQSPQTEQQTSSDLSISEKEPVQAQELTSLTRRSLSVLSQSSSRQSTVNPIKNNLPQSRQLKTNRREVANADQTAWQNASHTESTIQITIGRIEVRANNPPTSSPAPSKSSQRTPKLSLQDYLKQRQGEK